MKPIDARACLRVGKLGKVEISCFKMEGLQVGRDSIRDLQSREEGQASAYGVCND